MKSPLIELIERLFKTRDLAHLRHLVTESYSEHVALQEFYEELINLIDDLVEAIQGVNRQLIELLTIPTTKTNEVDIQEYLQVNLSLMEDLEATRPIDNIIDDISTLHATTLYKLRFLR